MNNNNISVFENINRQMQELHELEMQLIQIDNQLYDIIKIDDSVDNNISHNDNINVDVRHSVNVNNNVSLDNNNSQRYAKVDSSYLNRYTSIKDPRIMKMRTYNVSDSDDAEYISKVYNMR